ncbi:MAG TPA: hypothetical protein VN893_10080 [Bryobacteraceae bacterium]|nr:hypothetical protein [Bryobacteraceae bacterium]
MLYFPQLASGAVSQFPCRKHVQQRTLVNVLADGSEVKLFDPGACRVEWEIDLASLTNAEWSAILSLFGAVEGQLGTFTFLDPFGNLLSWSEAPGAAAWANDAGLTLTGGVGDPQGGAGATRIANSSGAAQSVRQTAAVPSWYRYCFSVWARSSVAGQSTLFVSAGTESAQQTLAVGPAWQRLVVGSQLTTQQGTATFGVTIPGGATVELFGFQAEAQVGASRYKATGAQSGVYANVSFLNDVLEMTSEAPAIYSCPVRIGAKG